MSHTALLYSPLLCTRERLPTMEASSTTMTCREVSPPESLRSARIWVSDKLGMPVPVSRPAAVLAATAVPMTRKPDSSYPIRAAPSMVDLPVPACPMIRS